MALALPAGAAARIAPFAAYVTTLAAINLAWPGDRLPLTLYPLIIVATLIAFWIFRRSYSELREPIVADGGELLVAVTIGLAVLAVWVGIDTPLLRFADSKGYAPVAADGQVLWGWVALRTAGSTLIVPVMEELFWRSFVMRWLDGADFLGLSPRAVSWRAVLLSIIPFALEHSEVFAGAVAGLAYTWLYRHFGRLWPAIIAHGVSNLGLGLWIMTTRQWTYW